MIKKFGGSKVLLHYGGGSAIDSSKAIAAGTVYDGDFVETLCYGDGREGSISGFVTLDTDDCHKIYELMI